VSLETGSLLTTSDAASRRRARYAIGNWTAMVRADWGSPEHHAPGLSKAAHFDEPDRPRRTPTR